MEIAAEPADDNNVRMRAAKCRTYGHIAGLFWFPAPSGLESHIRRHRLAIQHFLAYDKKYGMDKASVAWRIMIPAAFPSFKGITVEDMLVRMVLRVLLVREQNPAEDLCDMTEHWGGSGVTTRAHVERDMLCAVFDKSYCDAHDCRTGPGLALWLDSLSATNEGRAVVSVGFTVTDAMRIAHPEFTKRIKK